MNTEIDPVDAAIDAWVADQLAASPEWTPEHYGKIRAYLDPTQEHLDQAA